MKENIYNKKFSFGIDLEIELEEYRKIINKYGKYISSVYFSLPFGDEFHSRLKMRDEYGKKGAIDKLFDILMLFKSEKIKLEAVINQYNIDTTSLKNALNELKKFIKVDAICCLNEYADIILKYYNENIYLVSSYNNGPIHRENIKGISSKYNMVVLGKEFMREPKLIREVRERGFDIKLLVNGGCSFNCFNCRAGKNNCVKVFNNNFKAVKL